ncbi:CotS family spore coat protein [Defluviitalea saccharophila]|uniref:CotS family spore coat protein n=1 Tax=Defluviitalea saccharophila TaxID=879970 RepID=A0ABZ2Y524_9FIRM
MKGLNPEIVRGFGYKLKAYTPFRNSFICETNQGIKVIQAMDGDIPQLLFQHSAKEHLYQNGFKWVDRFYISERNAPYYIHEGTIYVMTDWVDGRECDFDSLEDIIKAVSTLADMHKVSKGMIPVEGSRIKYDERSLPLVIKKRTNELSTMKKRINKQSRMSDFDLVFLKHYRYYEELCMRSLEWLEKSDYNAIHQKVKKEKWFYHNDYTYHNLIMVPSGDLYVTHFEECRYGLPIYDLVSVLKKIMKKHNWDIHIASKLLSLYMEKVNISEEKNILISLLILPDDFLKVCNRYYNTRRAWASQSLLRKLNLIIEQKENVAQFIDYIESL